MFKFFFLSLHCWNELYCVKYVTYRLSSKSFYLAAVWFAKPLKTEMNVNKNLLVEFLTVCSAYAEHTPVIFYVKLLASFIDITKKTKEKDERERNTHIETQRSDQCIFDLNDMFFVNQTVLNQSNNHHHSISGMDFCSDNNKKAYITHTHINPFSLIHWSFIYSFDSYVL